MNTLKQLIGVILTLVVIISACLAFSVTRLDKVSSDLTAIQSSRYLSAQLADELRQSSDDLTRLARLYVISVDPMWEQQYFDVLNIRNGKTPRPEGYEKVYWDFLAAGIQPEKRSDGATEISLLDMMKNAGFTEKELGLLEEASNNSDDLVRTETVAMNMVKGLYQDAQGGYTLKKAPDLETARMMLHDADYHLYKAKIMKPVNDFLYSLDERTQRQVDEAMQQRLIWQKFLLLSSALMMIAAIASLWLIYRWINNRLGSEAHVLVEIVREIASGDMRRTLVSCSKNKNSVMNALNDMVYQMSGSVSQVRLNAQAVAAGSARISDGNVELRQRTEKQARSIENTVSSMEQMDTTVKHNATNASEANQLTRDARDVALKGGKVVGEVIETMKEINASSQTIANIINVIDDIAFQTNLLALNAAVESARAGEQGRGFAVVASEVRTLAQRSAGAAEEVKSHITNSVSRVDLGSKLVDEAGKTMSDIVDSITRVNEIMDDISTASSEQSLGVAQTAITIGDIDRATQQNASMVEKNATASIDLNTQSQQMLEAVAVFKIKEVDD